MAVSPLQKVVDHLRRAAVLQESAHLRDEELLSAFLAHRDEAAFEALVRRHGPMVLGVCRRVLRDRHDAEDAFQATFMVLVRKASSIGKRARLVSWLYGVAERTAWQSKKHLARRRARELAMPKRESAHAEDLQDWLPLLDQELSRLPDKYRTAIILCDLEGKTRKQAAEVLSVPEGTLSTRLERGRALLTKRLKRHGAALSACGLAAALAQNAATGAVPPALLAATVKAGSMRAAGTAAGALPATVAALTEGVVKMMLVSKLKVMAVVGLLAVGVAGGGLAARSGFMPIASVEQAAQAASGNADEPKSKEAIPQSDPDLLKRELSALEGLWMVFRYEKDGKTVEQNDAKATSYTSVEIKGNKLSVTLNGKTLSTKFAVEPTKSPKWLDARPDPAFGLIDIRDARLVDRSVLLPIPWHAIYELKGDELKICFDVIGVGKRPTEFKTTPNSGLGLFVLRRVNFGQQRPIPVVGLTSNRLDKIDVAQNEVRLHEVGLRPFPSKTPATNYYGQQINNAIILKATPGFNVFEVHFSDANKLAMVQFKVLLIRQDEIYFGNQYKAYALHIGQTVAEAFKNPLTKFEATLIAIDPKKGSISFNIPMLNLTAHTVNVAKVASITIDGFPCALGDLKPGTSVWLQMGVNQDPSLVIGISAAKKQK